MTRKRTSLPVATWEGTFRVFGVRLRCYILDNGQRIINADDFAQLFEVMGSGQIPEGPDDLSAFAKWQRGES